MAYYKCGSIHPTQNSNVVVDTASGAIANFQTPLAMPLLDAQIDVNAVQDLHGQSGAYPAGGSAQKWDEEWLNGYLSSTDGSYISDANAICSKNFIEIQANTNYFLYKASSVPNTYVCWYDVDQLFISRELVNNSVVASPNNAKYFKVSSYGYGTTYNNNISINYPSTDTAYHPYSNICPINGWDEISVAHRGSNLFDISTKTNGVFLVWNSGETYNDAKSIVADYIEVKEGVAFRTNYNAQWCCYDKNKNYLGNIVAGSLVKTSGNDTKINTIPSGYGVYYLRLGYRSTTNNDEDMTEKTDIMFNVGNTIMPFEPYNGSTALIQLNNTYYGGRFIQDKSGKRKFEVTCVKEHFDLSGVTPTSANGFDSWLFNLANNATSASSSRNKLCDALGTYAYANSSYGSEHFYLGGSDLVLYFKENTFRNGSVDAVYPLAEPYTIDLPDGTPFKSLPGVNNIFADTGDTAVKFRKIG